MEKIKIALWGITDAIWQDVKVSLDWRKVQILMFIDNDPYIDGKTFEGIKIRNYNHFLLKEIKELDYILIAAYSGYQEILQLLKRDGICAEKIQLYISRGLERYCFGEIENVNKSLIERIYNEPSKIIEAAENYNHDVRMLVEGDINLRKENQDKWYKQNSIIAHACGGYVNGEKVKYSNSREALESTLKSGAKVIECDVLGIEHNEVICAHDYNQYWDAMEFGYTLQTLEDVLKKIVEYPDVYLLVDIKWEHVEEYDSYLSYILDSIERISAGKKELKKQLKKQIILEVYNEATIQSAQKSGFDVFFTQYRNEKYFDCKKVVELCLKYDIGVVGYGFRDIQAHSKMLTVFRQKGISVFGFSSDSITEYSEMRKKGLDGIFSNFIREG